MNDREHHFLVVETTRSDNGGPSAVTIPSFIKPIEGSHYHTLLQRIIALKWVCFMQNFPQPTHQSRSLELFHFMMSTMMCWCWQPRPRPMAPRFNSIFHSGSLYGILVLNWFKSSTIVSKHPPKNSVQSNENPISNFASIWTHYSSSITKMTIPSPKTNAVATSWLFSWFTSLPKSLSPQQNYTIINNINHPPTNSPSLIVPLSLLLPAQAPTLYLP